MVEVTLALNGMSCAACEKLIMQTAQTHGVQLIRISIPDGTLTVDCETGELDSFKAGLREKGFTERTESERGSYRRFFQFILNIAGGKKEFAYESGLLNAALLAFVVLAVGAGGLFFLQILPQEYLSLMFLSIIGSVALMYTYTHATSYQRTGCMNGMMSGMTLGMIGGFLNGLLIGATNGMFIGSVAGIIVGIVLGLGAGRRCGVMGAMEGTMGGFMSGIMGAMTAVMMLNDNLLVFLYLSFGVGIAILGGLSYMFYREGIPVTHNRSVHTSGFVMASAYLSFFLVMVMVHAPKGPITFI